MWKVMVASVVACAAHAGADILVEQPPRPVAGESSVGYFSDSRVQFGGATQSLTADNFTLPDAATVTGVRWWGSPAYPPLPQPPPSTPHRDITAFRIDLFADTGSPGRPGALLQSATVPLAGIAIAPTGEVILDRTIFRYDATLPSEWTLAPGTSYWLSVSAEITVANSNFRWTWRRSTDVDRRSAAYGPPFSNVWRSLSADDLAFSLQGTVPGPAGAGVLVAAGVAAVVRRSRPTR